MEGLLEVKVKGKVAPVRKHHAMTTYAVGNVRVFKSPSLQNLRTE
jgi:hypothetical protein